MISLAIEPKTAADEKKLRSVLKQLKIEDPSFTFKDNAETGQLLIYGMGELHLEVIRDRLERDFHVGLRAGFPQVSYRESISSQAQASQVYRRDVGGKMQFGQVTLQVEPASYQGGVLFESASKKNALPKDIVMAIEKSVHDTALGGNPGRLSLYRHQSDTTGGQVRRGGVHCLGLHHCSGQCLPRGLPKGRSHTPRPPHAFRGGDTIGVHGRHHGLSQ